MNYPACSYYIGVGGDTITEPVKRLAHPKGTGTLGSDFRTCVLGRSRPRIGCIHNNDRQLAEGRGAEQEAPSSQAG